MKDLSIFIKDIGFDTGVVVSVRHLSALLEENKIDYEVLWYKNDRELVQGVKNCRSKCINLQVPSFSDQTMDEIFKMNKNIVLSIHSTMCNLQVEDGALERIINWSKEKNKNFRITCPSLCEVEGFNAFSKVEFIYLPNTFSYKVNESELLENIQKKSKNMKPIKVSLFCAYRPFKNIITQVVALAKIAKKYPIELHLFNNTDHNNLFKNVKDIVEMSNIKLVLHDGLINLECFELTKKMHLGLQVSLSETFSYVAFEHMIAGVPVVASDSVPFASCVAKFSDVNHMEKAIEKIISAKDSYKKYSLESMKIAKEVLEQNTRDALDAIRRMIDN